MQKPPFPKPFFLIENPLASEVHCDISPNKMYFVLTLAHKSFKGVKAKAVCSHGRCFYSLIPLTLISCTKVLVINSWSHDWSNANCVSAIPVPRDAALNFRMSPKVLLSRRVPFARGEKYKLQSDGNKWKIENAPQASAMKEMWREQLQWVRGPAQSTRKMLQFLPLLPITKLSQKMETFLSFAKKKIKIKK